MKIAYLSTFYPFRGGIAQFNASLYRAFESNHVIKAFTFKRQYPDFLFPGETQFVTESDSADKIDSERLLDTMNPLSYYATAKQINSYGPDLLVSKFWMPFFAPALGKVSRKLSQGTSKVSILDNVIPHEKRPGDIALIKYFLKSQSSFVVMSETVRKDLLSLLPEAKYIMFPHPVYDHFGDQIPKVAARKKLNIPIDKKVLLFFGFIRDYKGLDMLIRSMDSLPDEYHLIIAGEVYGSFDKYQNIIDELKLSGKITLAVRYIGDSEVSVFFSAADVCVLPYRSGTQSGIVGIAYHFNLPLLATDVGSLKEMIEPFDAGMMITDSDEKGLTNSIKNFFDSSTNINYGKNIELYKQKYNWNTLADTISGCSIL